MFQYFTAATYSADAIVKQMIVLMSDAFQASKNTAQECFMAMFHYSTAAIKSANAKLKFFTVRMAESLLSFRDTVGCWLKMLYNHTITAKCSFGADLRLIIAIMVDAFSVFQDTIYGCFAAMHQVKFKLDLRTVLNTDALSAIRDNVQGCFMTMFNYFAATICSADAKLKQTILLMDDTLRAIWSTVQGYSFGAVAGKLTLIIAASIGGLQAFHDSVREWFTTMYHSFVASMRSVNAKLNLSIASMAHSLQACKDAAQKCITRMYHHSTADTRSMEFLIVRTANPLRAFRDTVQEFFKIMHYQSVAAACSTDAEPKPIIVDDF